MLKISINDPNFVYRDGMENLLIEVFHNKQGQPVQFEELTSANATQVDVIVKNFVAGEEYVCQPLLKFRSKPGLIIGLVDGDKNLYHHELPLCIKNILFINRSESLTNIRERVIHAWKETVNSQSHLQYKKCFKCKCRTLTSQQVTIAKFLLRGYDNVDMAKSLEISVKAVSAHKRLMMSKFNIRSDCELLLFIKNLKMHNPSISLLMDKHL